jgi:O-antigen biosynthesis protein WbqP
VLSQQRAFDIVLSMLLILLLSPVFLIVALIIKVTAGGSAIYWSNRVGKDNRLFWMPKFRTMRADTPEVATHLLSDPSMYLTPIGRFLRRTSLDEVPQLFSILAGDLSFVGPRPALFNQTDLIALRTERGIHVMVPGLTGWAQVHGRDDLPIPAKVQFDYEYMERKSFALDLQILCMTIIQVLRCEGVK